MTQQQTRGPLGRWKALILFGVICNAIGLFTHVPVWTLLGAPTALVGVIGLFAARRPRT
ncbi:hypothetical protein ACIGXA_16620 [Streptomyces fildesensis]|uniref:Integral membrane protein n=1 Tax=Streptomyces fildesensis TaxID=375757 RepID=A0ABW8C6V1_9ACTN